MINDFHPRPLRERILPSGTVKTHDPSRTLVRNSNNPRFDESRQDIYIYIHRPRTQKMPTNREEIKEGEKEGRGGSRRSPLQQVTALINPLFSNDPGIRSFHHHHPSSLNLFSRAVIFIRKFLYSVVFSRVVGEEKRLELETRSRGWFIRYSRGEEEEGSKFPCKTEHHARLNLIYSPPS